MIKIVVLGAGRVGSAIARDLVREDAFSVSVADASGAALERMNESGAIQGFRADLTLGEEIDRVARTTGYTCSAVARLVIDGTFRTAGVVSLEHLGRDPGCYRRVLEHLAGRGIAFVETSL